MNTPVKPAKATAPNLQRWVKSVTRATILLNAEKDFCLPMSSTNLHGPKDVRVTEIRLYV